MTDPSGDTRLRIGRGIAILRGSTRILLDERNGELADRLWHATADADDVADVVLEELSATGLRALGDFAIAEHEPDGVRFVVRGAAVAKLLGDDTTVDFDAGDSRTWAEQVVTDASGYVLALGSVDDEDGLPFCARHGVLPADVLAWGAGLPAAPVEGTNLSWVDEFDPVVPASEQTSEEPGSAPGSISSAPMSPETPSDVEPEEIAEPDCEPIELWDVQDVEDAAPPADLVDADPAIDEARADGTSDETSTAIDDVSDDASPTTDDRNDDTIFPSDLDDVQTGKPAPEELDDEEGFEYDELFGKTQMKQVDLAGVVLDDEGKPHAPTSESSADERSDPSPEPSVPAVVESPVPTPAASAGPLATEPSAGGGGLIDGIPGASTSPSPVPSAEPGQRLGDHDGHTMSLAQLQALRSQQGAAAPRASQPALGEDAVHALVCPSGHPSPPTAVTCRICRVPISGDPVTIARPLLGRLRLSTGQVLDLDRPAIIGRAPKVEGHARGALPNTLALKGLDGISRSHVMLHLEQWQVLVEDLGSQNGTVVTLPGRPPQRLHPRVQVPVENGTLVDLAGEVTFTVELG